MTDLDLIFLVIAASLLMMIILQTVLNKRVWCGYLLGLPATLIVWVLAR